ncbi:MAG: hypothetical protein ACMXYD_03325 [Candidatus Woesearchaeota archaeon]
MDKQLEDSVEEFFKEHKRVQEELTEFSWIKQLFPKARKHLRTYTYNGFVDTISVYRESSGVIVEFEPSRDSLGVISRYRITAKISRKEPDFSVDIRYPFMRGGSHKKEGDYVREVVDALSGLQAYVQKQNAQK